MDESQSCRDAVPLTGGCAAVNLGLLFLLQESLPSRIGLILAIKHLHGVNS